MLYAHYYLPMKKILFLLAFLSTGLSEAVVNGRNFSIPATQQIEFVPLKIIDPALYADKSLSRVIDLKPTQSKVKLQGPRGACTYFVITGLVEGLIKKEMNKEVDLSEEYLAWATKTKKKLRSVEEDSSVAVNAATIQDFGLLLEEDLPYQQSWFDKGLPCEGQKGKASVDPICYSHKGPSPENSKRIIDGGSLHFEAVDSSSIDLVRSLSRLKSPVTASILGHPLTWDRSTLSGELVLTKELKKECQNRSKYCSGHAVLIVGYDLNKKIFTFKNSWGNQWGNEGYGTISFDYIDQMSERKFLTGSLNGKIDFRNLVMEVGAVLTDE